MLALCCQYSNDHYSAVGGIDLEELNNLEIEMITMLSFQLYVDETVYAQYISAINEYAAVLTPTKAKSPHLTSSISSLTSEDTSCETDSPMSGGINDEKVSDEVYQSDEDSAFDFYYL
eukprot:TRINITY_DN1979_c0_g2_i1.p3 TRINITY_DN1979_c0_g2~~TRINITY_DN1979_c0_g2_i1.p3  ORF type:complete len:118 (+),score=9.55 TRINITY_DN1979_c0_g2_i1:334-687(+)